MTYQESEIPLVGIEDCTDASNTTGIAIDEHQCHGLSLETQRAGLLAPPKRPLDIDRRMENWIASNLDIEPAPAPEQRSPWIRLIDGLPGVKHPVPERAREAETQGNASVARGLDAISGGVQTRNHGRAAR